MYSAKQKKMRRGPKSKRRFIQIFSNIKRSAAYHGASLGARCALIELLDKYTGCNNGMLSMGVRELADRLNCSQRGACNFLHELDDAGLAHPTKVGAWRGKQATQWRLTFYRCDLTGELPVTHWEPRPECTHETTKVHPRNHRDGLSAPAKPQTPKNSINGSALSASTKPYLDIYQREGGTMQARARHRAGIEPSPDQEAPASPSTVSRSAPDGPASPTKRIVSGSRRKLELARQPTDGD
jgi:hypothetical protein